MPKVFPGLTIIPPKEIKQEKYETIMDAVEPIIKVLEPNIAPIIEAVKPILEEIPQVLGDEPKDEPEEPKVITKEVLDNSHIIKMKEKTTVIEKQEEPIIKYETNIITDNELEGNSCARFKITTNIPSDILNFGYEIVTDATNLHQSHIENITGNNVSLIVNNLTDNDMIFSITYFSVHSI